MKKTLRNRFLIKFWQEQYSFVKSANCNLQNERAASTFKEKNERKIEKLNYKISPLIVFETFLLLHILIMENQHCQTAFWNTLVLLVNAQKRNNFLINCKLNENEVLPLKPKLFPCFMNIAVLPIYLTFIFFLLD